MSRRYLPALSLVFMVALVTLISTPVSAVEPSDEVDGDLKTRLLEHRTQEAAGKAARAKAWVEGFTPPTANQDLYDVQHYYLDLNVDTSAALLGGWVTVTAEVTGASIATMDLDLDAAMSVLGATSDGAVAATSRNGDVLTVTLDRVYTTGESVVVAVEYIGNPAGGSFGWDSFDGKHMIWTLSEPYGAREWWPCKDFNTDKADSVDIEVTVPDNLIVASNGLLESQSSGGGTATFHWKTLYPIPTYLVSLAIHPYLQYSDWYTPQGGGDDMEVQFYVFTSHWGAVQSSYALTVPMIDAFAQGFGEYPFVDEKYGHAEFVWGGGMEHQTISSMGGWTEDLISHELAHQWWGDMVTCADFGHIWLNEGFATWSEAYWKEQTDSFATYQAYMDAAAYYGEGTIFVEDPNNFGEIFSTSLSYNKASWVVHMLRGVLGDTDFFAGLDLYRANHAYSTATTGDLQAAMETVGGIDLTAFFDQWIYGEYFPVYALGWSTGPGAGEITVNIEQVQTNTGVFTMPITLRVVTDLGSEDIVVQNDQAVQQYVLPVTGTVEDVLLDPDRWILRQVQTTVTNPTFAQGILLVNGVDWDTYGSEITTAYDDSTFSGSYPVDFWDTFAEPSGGYPATVPAPLGHGPVPGGVLGSYSTVIWVGNSYNGDLAKWAETPIMSYLEAGGNLLLMTRYAESFVAGDLSTYLGVTWAGSGGLGNCVAQEPGLTDIPFIGSQSLNDVFYTDVALGSTLLFTDTTGFGSTRGTGVWADPGGTGLFRPEGGQFVLLAGRPYRMDHAALRQNVEYILGNMLGEPYASPSPVPDGGGAPILRTALLGNRPNPFNPSTTISYELARESTVRLTVHDLAGRHIRTLVDGRVETAGRHEANWDGRDGGGRPVAAGVYFTHLKAADTEATRRVMLVK